MVDLSSFQTLQSYQDMELRHECCSIALHYPYMRMHMRYTAYTNTGELKSKSREVDDNSKQVTNLLLCLARSCIGRDYFEQLQYYH